MKKMNILYLLLLFTVITLASCSQPTQTLSTDKTNGNQHTITTNPTNSETIIKEGLWNTDHIDVSHINPDNRLIALTFDDGPSTDTSLNLIKAFNDFNAENPEWEAHATVFYKGSNVTPERGDIIKKAYEAGFEIGNHTYNHLHLETLTEEKILLEINQTLTEIKKYVPIEHTLIRPPFGTVNDLVKNTVPYPMINWTTTPDLDTHDYEYRPTDFIYTQVFQRATDGGIVLMHEGYPNTVAAVKKLLTSLKDKGFQVCSVSELAKVRGINLYAGEVYTAIIEE